MADCGVISDLLDNPEHVNAFWKAIGVGDVAEVQKVLDGGWVEEIDCTVVGRELKGDVGLDLDPEGHWGRSALMVASGRGHCDLVRFLLEKGAQVDFQDCYGKSALMLASECGQCEVARLLLDRGAEVGLRDCVNGKSALMVASECGQCEVVKLLLDRGAQVDLQDQVGRTAIVLASKHEHWKVGMLLLERMAGVDSATLSAIMSAVMVKCKSLLREYWLEEYLEPEFFINELIKSASLTECYQEILWLACGCGNFKICQAFVAKCHWVELSPLWGRALFLACDHCEIVALLLERGFPQDLVHYGEYSAPAMVGACKSGHCEIVGLLLGRGANVDATTDFKKYFRVILDWQCIPYHEDVFSMPELALVAAARNGHAEIVRLLLDKGARVGLHSAVTSAIQEGFQEVVEVFMECCAEKDLFDDDGCSPLMFATRHGHFDMAKWLLEKGAQIDLQDKSGRSAVMIASEYQRWDVGKLLIERGAEADSTILSFMVVDHRRAFWKAIRDGHVADIKKVLETGKTDILNTVTSGSDLFNDADDEWDLVAHRGRFALTLASWDGHHDMVKFLLDNGAQVDSLDHYSKSALMVASECGHVEVARLLLDYGAEVDLRGLVNGKSALVVASEYGQCEVVKLLLDAGAQVNLQDKSGRSAIMIASEYQRCDVGKLLIEMGAEVDTTILSALWSSLILKCQDCLEPLDDTPNAAQIRYLEDATLLIEKGALIDVETLLVFACVSGDVYISRLILEESPWVEENDRLLCIWGGALYLACSHGHYEIVALLLEKGFPRDLVHYGGYSAASIVFACKGGHCEVVKLLLGRGADVNSALDGESALVSAVSHRHKIDMCDSESKSALVYAARGGNLEVVKLLLGNGALVGLHSAVTCAMEHGHGDVVEFFTGSYAEKDLLDRNGSSPLMFASKHGHYEIAELLLEKSAQVDMQDNDGCSPLMFASKHGHYEIARLLLEKGAQVDLQDSDGRSALKFASKGGFHDLAKLLLGEGAQVDLQGNDGCSPLMFASKHGHYEIAKLLLEKGAQVDQSWWIAGVLASKWNVMRLY